MGTGIYFPVAGLFFSILLVSVYFSKRKIKTFETDIYGILIITNFVGLILEILCTYAAMIYNDNRLIADLILIFSLANLPKEKHIIKYATKNHHAPPHTYSTFKQ